MKLKIGVCECPAEMFADSWDWQTLCLHVSREHPELFLLNEMPFGPWISSRPSFDQAVWDGSCHAHREGARRLMELGANTVAGSRPAAVDGLRINEGFVWTQNGGIAGVHTKQYFPDEEGYYEAR